VTPAGATSAPQTRSGPVRIFLVAGEPSGDRLGAQLMAALKRRFGDVTFSGIGGDAMAGEGLRSLFPMRELTLMGFAEVLPHLPRLLRRLRQTVTAIGAERPDLVVTIDSPGFNGRLLDRLRDQPIATAHYGAPAVWAWRPGRLRHWVGRADRLLAILPFEPPIFTAAGIDCHYVGHPVLEEPLTVAQGIEFRRRQQFADTDRVVGLLPGSRRSELRHILPVLRDAADRILQAEPRAQFLLPTLPALAAELRSALSTWRAKPRLIDREVDRRGALAACDLALAASGTVTLELASVGTPMVIVYRAGWISSVIARRLIRVRYVGLPNLLLDRPLVPELLQEACEPVALAKHALTLLGDPEARAQQKAGLQEAVARLAIEGRPSDRAAGLLADLLARPARGL
jgi:lipid-A-disaccharide synthase